MLGPHHFCHNCGSIYLTHERGRTELTCGVCGMTTYLNALPVANLLLPYDGDGLIAIRRGNEPRAGFFTLPGGFIMLGERWQYAGAREAEEEAQVVVKRPDEIEPFMFESISNGTQLITFGRVRDSSCYLMYDFKRSVEAVERCIIRRNAWSTWKPQMAFNLHIKAIERYFDELKL